MNLLKRLRYISILLDNGLLICYSIINTTLHLENPILIKSPYKILPPIDHIFYTLDSVFENVKAFLFV